MNGVTSMKQPDGELARVQIGLCGFTLAMAEYPQRFPMVEVQQTFYHPPADGVMRRWRTSMPTGFEFTIKAWQLITHTPNSPTYRRLRRELTFAERSEAGGFRDTSIVREAWEVTLAAARTLSATAVLFQCPASFRPTEENLKRMRRFLRRAGQPKGLRLLWEPRGPWPAKLVASMCQDYKLVHVVDPFVTRTVTSGLTYYRLHGISGARHVYSDDELLRLRDMLPREGKAYVLFNNIPRVNDARRFAKVLGVDLPNASS
jgi:uncharacterized protein YecE (DUF72 family)